MRLHYDKIVNAVAIVLMSTSVLGLPVPFEDQACNTEVTDGDIPDDSISQGASSSSNEARALALQNSYPACALCDPEGEERCPSQAEVTVGEGAALNCFPVFVPLGHPPIWLCEFDSGTGSTYDQTCGDC